MKKKQVEEMYPEGTRIVIDPIYTIHSIKECKTGVVCGIDDNGEMLIKWDDGGEGFVNCDRTRLHKININDVPVARRYERLLGVSSNGSEWLENVWQAAEFACRERDCNDISIYTEDKFLITQTIPADSGCYLHYSLNFGNIGDWEVYEIFYEVLQLMENSLYRDCKDKAENSVPTSEEFKKATENELESLTSDPLCFERYNVQQYITSEEYIREINSAYNLLTKRMEDKLITRKMLIGGYAKSFAYYIYKLNEF